jgi:transposase
LGQIALYSGVERRRRWTDAERLEILSEAFAPGAIIAQVARRHDVSTGQIYTWRRKLWVRPPAGPDASALTFTEAILVDDSALAPSGTAPIILIELERGKRVSIRLHAGKLTDPAALGGWIRRCNWKGRFS